MKKYLFIINPAAGHFDSGDLVELINKSAAPTDHLVEIIFTEYPLHASELTEKFTKDSSYDYIISAGGDGTLNEVINGFTADTETSLGVLPVGSGNDFVKNLKYPKGTESIVKFLFDEENYDVTKILPGSVNYHTDDGKIFQRKFINSLGVGFDAYVAFINRKDKILPGWISYFFAVFKGMKEFKKLNCSLEIDKSITKSGDFLLLSAGIGKSSGGGFYLTPHAEPLNDHLELTTVDYAPRLTIISKLPKALVNKMDDVKEAKFYRIETVTIDLENSYFVHIDGEILSDSVKKLQIKRNSHHIKFIRGK